MGRFVLRPQTSLMYDTEPIYLKQILFGAAVNPQTVPYFSRSFYRHPTLLSLARAEPTFPAELTFPAHPPPKILKIVPCSGRRPQVGAADARQRGAVRRRGERAGRGGALDARGAVGGALERGRHRRLPGAHGPLTANLYICWKFLCPRALCCAVHVNTSSFLVPSGVSGSLGWAKTCAEIRLQL